MPNSLPKLLHHFAFPPALYRSCCCSTSLSAFVVVIVEMLPNLMAVQWHLIVLIFISLLTYDVKHLLICLFAICISYLLKCVLRSFSHFKKWVIVFLLLSFLRVFHIFWMTILYHMSFTNIFSQFVALF